jgi:hypothetical protein
MQGLHRRQVGEPPRPQPPPSNECAVITFGCILPFFWTGAVIFWTRLAAAQKRAENRASAAAGGQWPMPPMDPLTISLLIIAGGILLGPRVLFAVILIPTALFIGLLALLLVIGGTVLVARDRRAAGTGR